MADLSERVISEPDSPAGVSPKPATIWQEWTKKRAQHAPTLEKIREITKKVKMNVTQAILDERQEH